MQTIKAILDKMETPLRFAVGESFRHLHLLRDVESLMEKLLAQLSQALRERGHAPDDREIGALFTAWQNLFKEFDQRDLDEKKTLDLQSPVPAPDMTDLLMRRFRAASETEDHRHGRELLDLAHHIKRLALPIQYVKGVGPRTAQLLERKNLRNVEDLLYFLPHRYEDRRFVKPIAATEVGRRETVIGEAVHVEMKMYGRRRIFEVTFRDGTGTLTAKWFRGQTAYLKTTFKIGKRYILTGEVSRYYVEINMLHPDFELLGDEEEDLLHFKRIVPVYSETEGLRQKAIRRIMMEVAEHYAADLMSPIPEDVSCHRRLMDVHQALQNVHFPPQDADIKLLNDMRSDAHRRLIYDEFFFFQLGMALKKKGTVLAPGISFTNGWGPC